MTAELLHIQILNQELEDRLRRNPRYSLRSFARDLAVAPSWISDVLNGKKGISAGKAQDLCKCLGFSRQETETFVLSVKAHHSRKASDRRVALDQLKKMKSLSSAIQKLTDRDLEEAGSWYHQAILELIELDDFDHTESWLVRKLNLSPKLVSSAVQRLIKLGWLGIEDGKMRSHSVTSETVFDVPSRQVKNYHVEILDKARVALNEHPVYEREFLSMTLAFNSKRMNEAKEEIRRFQTRFASKFYDSTGKKDSVHQLSVQFFRMDKKGNTL